ncbi:hypothetical protein LDENG_00104860 [Lucifuga dentata]|nr:hypothetical protein LDENG_00104860 [Lucifuga dentata]
MAAPGSSNIMAAECTPDVNPAKVIQNQKLKIEDSCEASPESALAVDKVRPADLELIRSLSKSDSDLLASPLGEAAALASRSGSVKNCRSGQKSMERSPSFASEWDEVIWVGKQVGG